MMEKTALSVGLKRLFPLEFNGKHHLHLRFEPLFQHQYYKLEVSFELTQYVLLFEYLQKLFHDQRQEFVLIIFYFHFQLNPKP